MASGTNPSSASSGQAAIDRFAEMMIWRMEQMKASDWKKGWIGGASGYAGLPQNVGGRNYSGSNSFFLQLHTAANGYDLPVFLTFKQAHNLKAHVLKGEKAFPVIYWDMLVKDKDGKKVSSEEYRAMNKEEKEGMEVIPFIKAFPVYNVDRPTWPKCSPNGCKSSWTGSGYPNSATRKACTPTPRLTGWSKRRAGSVRYKRTSVWTGPIIPPRTTSWWFP